MFNPLFIISISLVFLLAITFLIIFVKRIKPQGTLKKFLILAGISIVGFFISVLLHNLISALLSQFFKKEFDEPIFFLVAVFICPVGLTVGAMGSIIQLIKQRGRF